MIRYSVAQIAAIVGGSVHGDPELTIDGIEIDSRIIQAGEMFAPIKGERVNGHDFVVSMPQNSVTVSLWRNDEAGMPDNVTCIAVDSVEEALITLAEHYRQQFHGKVIGVTGSSGKTSTKDMIASVLGARYRVHKTSGNQNNDLGIPRTILSADEDDDYVIVEMGIDHIGEMQQYADLVNPDITVIASIAPAHMMNFLTMDTIVREKCTINANLNDGQCYYAREAYGLHDHLLKQGLKNKPLSYGYDDDSDIVITSFEMNEQGSSFTLSTHPGTVFHAAVLGRKLVQNLTAAISIATREGMTDKEIQKGLDELVLTPHRLQVKHINGATVIDDAYNSNPASLTAALNLLLQIRTEDNRYAVLGDMLELGETSGQLHCGIADEIDFRNFAMTILYGTEMHKLYEKLSAEGIPAVFCDSFENLYETVRPLLNENATMLFKASNSMKFISLIDKLEESYEN